MLLDIFSEVNFGSKEIKNEESSRRMERIVIKSIEFVIQIF